VRFIDEFRRRKMSKNMSSMTLLNEEMCGDWVSVVLVEIKAHLSGLCFLHSFYFIQESGEANGLDMVETAYVRSTFTQLAIGEGL